MSDLIARTGRLQQRYEDGCRLIAGCIPSRYRNSEEAENSKCGNVVEVLMISSSSGPGLLFPKGGWENDETVREAAAREAVEEAGVRGTLMDLLGEYEFKSKSHQDKFCPEGVCKASMYVLYVKEVLESWPKQETRTRTWLTIPEALENCRHTWMKCAFLSIHFWQHRSFLLVRTESDS